MNNIIFPNSFTVKPDSTMQLGLTKYKLDQVKNALRLDHNIGCLIFIVSIITILMIVFLIIIRHYNKIITIMANIIAAIIKPAFIGLIILFLIYIFRPNQKIQNDYVNNTGIRLKQTNFIIKEIPKHNNANFLKNNTYILANNIRKNKTTTLTSYKLYAKVKQNQKQVYIGTIKNNKINFSNNSESALLKKYSIFIQDKHLENDFKDNAKLVYDIDYLDQDNKPQLVLKGKNNKTLHLTTHNNKVQIN